MLKVTTMENLRCLTDHDGYDPFAEPGSPERGPSALLDRLCHLGLEPYRDARGRWRLPAVNTLPEWLKDAIREDWPSVLALLKRPAA